MSDSLKNNEMLAELIRYINNKMTNSERNDFERAIERDPFLAEALEGLSEFKTLDVEHDLNAIDVISGKRKRKIKPLYILSIAASILIIITVFLINPFKKEEVIVAEKPVIKKLEKTETKSLVKLEDDSANYLIADTIKTLLVEVDVEAIVDVNDTNHAKQKQIIQRTTESAGGEVMKGRINSKKVENKPILYSAVKNEEKLESENTPEISSVMQSTQSIEDVFGEAEMVENKIEEAVAPEITVNDINKRIGVNASSEPLGGNNLFQKYIEENIKYPNSEESPKRQVVKVRFEVTVNGDPTNFSIVKGPENADFGNEAIRLIKNGPKWSPTVKDGILIQDEVDLRIVFKP